MNKCSKCGDKIFKGDIYYTIERRKLILSLGHTANVSLPKMSNRYCSPCFLELVGAKEVLLF